MSDAGVTLTRRTRPSPAEAEQLRAIYLAGFPPSQRVDFDGLLEAVAEGDVWLFTAHAGGDVAGFALVHPMPLPGLYLLDYFAVAPEQRGRGLGGAVLRLLAEQLAGEPDAWGMLLEVESDEWGSEAERALRRRRIGFYRRNGASLVEALPVHYGPSMVDDSLLELKLMWLPLRPDAPPPTGPDLRRAVIALYEEAYGLPPHHPLVRRSLDRL